MASKPTSRSQIGNSCGVSFLPLGFSDGRNARPNSRMSFKRSRSACGRRSVAADQSKAKYFSFASSVRPSFASSLCNAVRTCKSFRRSLDGSKRQFVRCNGWWLLRFRETVVEGGQLKRILRARKLATLEDYPPKRRGRVPDEVKQLAHEFLHSVNDTRRDLSTFANSANSSNQSICR
jgi:hypothetical protein